MRPIANSERLSSNGCSSTSDTNSTVSSVRLTVARHEDKRVVGGVSCDQCSAVQSNYCTQAPKAASMPAVVSMCELAGAQRTQFIHFHNSRAAHAKVLLLTSTLEVVGIAKVRKMPARSASVAITLSSKCAREMRMRRAASKSRVPSFRRSLRALLRSRTL
jgi:hypothetical protein